MSDGIKLNIGQRMNSVAKQYGYLQKTKTVESYKAITYDDLIGYIRGYLIEAGIIIQVKMLNGAHVDTGRRTKKDSPIVRFDGTYSVRFCNADDVGDGLEYVIPGSGDDMSDKGPGKATTYAVKGAIVKAFMIETGEAEESRIQETDAEPLPSALRQEYVDKMAAAKLAEDLKAVAAQAYGAAREAGDQEAFEMFKAAVKKLGEKFRVPTVAMPAQVGGEPEPQVAEAPEAATKPPTTAAPGTEALGRPERAPHDRDEKKASAGLVKMLVAAIGDRAKMSASFLKLYGVESFAELDAFEVKEALRSVLARTKPKD